MVTHQQELQDFLQQLNPHSRPAQGGPLGPNTAGGALLSLPVKLTKTGPDDDPATFLTIFERGALVSQWPPEHWALVLAPYLMGQALLARDLDSEQAGGCLWVKTAILDYLDTSEMTHQLCLSTETYLQGPCTLGVVPLEHC